MWLKNNIFYGHNTGNIIWYLSDKHDVPIKIRVIKTSKLLSVVVKSLNDFLKSEYQIYLSLLGKRNTTLRHKSTSDVTPSVETADDWFYKDKKWLKRGGYSRLSFSLSLLDICHSIKSKLCWKGEPRLFTWSCHFSHSEYNVGCPFNLWGTYSVAIL